MPSTGSLPLSATVASANESNKNNDTTPAFATTQANQAPVAQNVWNTLQSARGNTSPTGLAISALTATDSDGTINGTGYVVVALPSSTQGTLYYNSLAVIAGQKVTADGLRFIPTAGYVGDATFTYTATDNSGAVSNTALYTIPVAQDQSTTYSIYNTNKGGANPYTTNDVLAQTIDPNTVQYNSSNLVYDATTGVLLSGAANGLATSGTNAVLASGSTLPDGVSLNAATGTIYVSAANLLPRSPSDKPYTVNVTTTDLNGGTNTVPVTFTIGANATPLPVVLTAFSAQAVRNRDALLTWTTAAETNNHHFDIERSFDGNTFAKIGQLAGHGTTAAATTYALTDAGVAAQAAGPVYYRLRQVDADGNATFSPVRSLRFAQLPTAQLSLFPNPVAASTVLDLSQLPAATTVQAQLLEATGRAVRSWHLAGAQRPTLDLTQLASGTYLLVLTGTQPDGAPLHQTLRITKE
ncbi:MAG: T9SS type A sorting domain-containing protein [Hymenobacter sp.]|nr:MAG: T9SS type A sorting domain-containing protein [Hymenobacter sp.]